jgi:hypothetical protein
MTGMDAMLNAVTPAEAGFAPALGERFEVARQAGLLPNLHAVMAARGGRVFFERYLAGTDSARARPLGVVRFGPDTLHDLRSVTKSVVGLLYGIALAAGRVPAPFATAAIAVSGFFHSLTCLATRKWFADEVGFVRREVGAAAPRQGRRVLIRCFTHGHRASTEWWFPNGRRKAGDPDGARAGKRCLAAVCRHLEGMTDLGYWSGDKAVVGYFEERVPGEQVRPKVAGSNLYRHHRSCGLVYSSKVRPEDAILLDVFGLTREEVERAREREDIWQFAMRGAIREADFDGTYTAFLYDRWQAEALAAMLREEGVADDVVLEPVEEAGILDVQRPRPGPKAEARAVASGKTFEQREAERRDGDRLRKQRQRARERAEKAAAGTLRGRGRPRATNGPETRP